MAHRRLLPRSALSAKLELLEPATCRQRRPRSHRLSISCTPKRAIPPPAKTPWSRIRKPPAANYRDRQLQHGWYRRGQPQGLLGPDDSDKEVIASSNGHNLYAVNQGSNSVAALV